MMVGESARSKHVFRQIDRVAQGRWPVLVLGETGTGKEVAARKIFGSCPVGEFVTIDCSSLVGTLLESELFGHARGAFTGAVGQKTGLLEVANGGTAFFDEVGELPLDLQAKLLRVLQEKEFRPVGSNAVRKSDFRIIAATNRDLAREVERGTFRRDLYYRLNVVTLRLAPLRERTDDIPVLVNHFLERYGAGYVMSPEVLDLLTSYDWPGNVRELENCVQQMVALNSGPMLTITEMPSVMQHFAQRPKGFALVAAAGASARYPSAAGALATADTLEDHQQHHYYTPASHHLGDHTAHSPQPDQPPPPPRRPPASEYEIIPLMEIEKREILRALMHTKGDRAVAANKLGIGRTTLYRKLKEYGVGESYDSFKVM